VIFGGIMAAIAIFYANGFVGFSLVTVCLAALLAGLAVVRGLFGWQQRNVAIGCSCSLSLSPCLRSSPARTSSSNVPKRTCPWLRRTSTEPHAGQLVCTAPDQRNAISAPQFGQFAVRSLTEIWIGANFKETQLADLRIGQRAEIKVDMYGRHHAFEGRITGFTMGTGSTLALLPAENATGNFVKIVQRLPVRIELTDYDPDKFPLFIGLSVEPHVYYKEPPTGPHSGDVLQPPLPLPEGPANPAPSAPATPKTSSES
jgi:hypothetical protein